MTYDDLDYSPTHGTIEVRGRASEWSVAVSVEQGRAMEKDGIPVCWVHSTIPDWAALPGLMQIWQVGYRIFTWPSRPRK